MNDNFLSNCVKEKIDIFNGYKIKDLVLFLSHE